MAGSSTIKCPSCGSYLAYTPGTRSITCPYCDTSITEAEFLRAPLQADDQASEAPASSVDDAGLRSYHCSNCGAEIVTGETTAATSCYYCHSPVVINDRLSSAYKPDGVIPFGLDKEKAEAAFTQFLKSRRFVDKNFFSQAARTHFHGVYYPYWVGEVSGKAEFQGEGTQVTTHRGYHEDTIITQYYRVERAGVFTARNLTRKGLKAADRQLSDGIHPYQEKEIKPYTPAYLSGFLAERRDVESSEVQGDMEREATAIASAAVRRAAASGYHTISGSTDFSLGKTDMRYVLMPAWILTYKGQNGEMYYYMMNGQTGTVCGKLPINKGKLWLTGLLTGGLVTALLMLGGKFLW